jgi:hypothetical protein
MRRHLTTLTLLPLFVAAGLVSGAPSAAAAVIAPRVITGVPMIPQNPPPGWKSIQKVVPLETISTQMAAGATAYLYSTLTAYNSAHANLIDNEVRCSGAGTYDVVLGENVLPSGDASRTRITIVNRFLVSATTSGTLSCTIYLRTTSTAAEPTPGATSRETIEGTIRFAATAVREDAAGNAMQESLPPGNIPVYDRAYAPALNRTLPPGNSKVAVIADVEYHRCYDGRNCPSTYSTAMFRLFVNTGPGTGCPSAVVAQYSETVPRGVNHAAIPLYTTVTVAPGCDELHAYVRIDHLGGDVGSVGGAAAGLTDGTGTSTTHTSYMTHMFAVPS